MQYWNCARKRKIAKELLDSQHPVTSDYLAKSLGVTSRTIRSDLKQMSEEGKALGLEIVPFRGVGYVLRFQDEQSHRRLVSWLAEDREPANIPTLPGERVNYILRKLLIAKDYITLEQLADELYVSKSTIDHDLRQAEKLLEPYQIKVLKKPHHGLKVVGNEINLRFCLSEYFSKGAILERDERHADPGYAFLPEQEVSRIRAIILNYVELIPVKLTDMALNNLIMHIAIAINRVKTGSAVVLNTSELDGLQANSEYEIAADIVRELENAFSIIIPREEIGYITIHLMGAKGFRDDLQETDAMKKVISDDILQLVMDMLQQINEMFGIDFSHDHELIWGLGLHLRSVVNRMKYHMNLRNPLLKEITESCPFAFELAVTASKALARYCKQSVNENEIAYIALHLAAALERAKNQLGQVRRIAIVCASGLGTAKLLEARIKQQFPGAVIVGSYPSFAVGKIKKEEVDLILSTVVLEHEEGIPVVHVRSLLPDEDLRKIQQKVALTGQLQLSKEQRRLDQLFRQDLFVTDIACERPDEIIRLLCERMLDRGYVGERYQEWVLEREQLSSTAIGNLVAIPHPMYPDSQGSSIAVAILKKPIQWQRHQVQLVFMMALDKEEQDEFERIFADFLAIVQNKSNIAKLLKAKRFPAFMADLREMIRHTDRR